MENASLHELADVDTDSFWFRAKQYYLDQMIQGAGGTILDVGCGSGGSVARFLAQGFRVVGIDRSEVAVQYGVERGLEMLRHDFCAGEPLRVGFTPDYITVLDFLEHVEDPVAVLRELRSFAGAHTKAIVFVPAYQWLWSGWDEAMHHVKRYRREVLEAELNSAGWAVERSGYNQFLPLVPAVLVRKVWSPMLRGLRPDREESFFRSSHWLNELLFQLYKPEFWMYRAGVALPAGLSVFALATPSAN